MSYDLRHEAWIPWQRLSGRIEWGPPAMLGQDVDADPVVALSSPRPDFDGAMQEFLIGLLGAALQPADDHAWAERWHHPPSVEELQAAFDAMPPAFDLDGDGPRFFQDFSVADLAAAEPVTIDKLLIDTPGDQTTRQNKDLFVKRGRTAQISRPAAAMALVTMQTYAPAGGQGYRTSLRGGGPLTTLVDPRLERSSQHPRDHSLWRMLWANVATVGQWVAAGMHEGEVPWSHVFPWTSRTRTSDPAGVGATTLGDGHPLQAYFGLPRRIRLEFGGPGQCDLTGREDGRTVTGFRTRNYGVQYVGWHHPLSPHYLSKPTGEWLPLHGQPGGVGWRDWLGLALGGANEARQPAAAVSSFASRARTLGIDHARLHVFGYDLDKMKVRGWTESLMPVHVLANEHAAVRLHDTVIRLREGAELGAFALASAVKNALFQNGKDAPGDYSALKQELWRTTEAPFYAALAALAAVTADAETADAQCVAFAATLEREAGVVFDRWCSREGLSPTALRRNVVARYDLLSVLRGRSKLGEKLFGALRIPLPEGARKPRAVKNRGRKEVSS